MRAPDGTIKGGFRLIASEQGFAVYDSEKRKIAVAAVDMMIRPGVPPMIMVAMPSGDIDVDGKALFAVVDPSSGRPRVVKRIEWADGQATDFPEPEKAASGPKVSSEQAPAGFMTDAANFPTNPVKP
jgi:hypothetical protein